MFPQAPYMSMELKLLQEIEERDSSEASLGITGPPVCLRVETDMIMVDLARHDVQDRKSLAHGHTWQS